MSLFEWLGEEDRAPRSNGIVLLCFFITIVLVCLIYYLVFKEFQLNLKNFGITTGTIILYSLIAYFIRPEPDTDDMGICGGMIDNPFSYSDNGNRFLMGLKIILMPGCFFTESTINMFLLLRNKKQMGE
jgi:hypothetical protein